MGAEDRDRELNKRPTVGYANDLSYDVRAIL
jgi:hypothetical protein